MMISVNPDLCAGCGACASACPESAIDMRSGTAEIEQTLCTECGLCIEACPNGAITRAAIIETPIQELTTKPVVSKGLKIGAALAAISLEVLPKILPPLIDRLATKPVSSSRSTRGKRNQPARSGGETCCCTSCGYSMEHSRGLPCRLTTCPRCGSRMRRL